MSAPTGLSFREVMAGAFALGETEPEAGARVGRRPGGRFTMYAEVAIPDLRGFLDDPRHAGRLRGRVSFEPLGRDLEAPDGLVQLFAPTSEPALKLMRYQLGFSHDGRAYWLDGEKRVRRHSVLHAWHDTTTLYCRLHEGRGPDGRVAGAGILRLTPWAFAWQLSTFRTTGAGGAVAGLGTVGRFLGFFTREVLDSYVRRARA